MKFKVFNIKYTGRESQIGIIGPDGLKDFVEKGLMMRYGSESAPTNYLVEFKGLDLSQDYILDHLDKVESMIKEKLEKELELTVKSFSFVKID